MPTLIPLVPSQGFYDFTTTLDGMSLGFVVRWNPIDLAFYFDIADQTGNVIAQSLKLVLGAYIGRSCQHKLFKDGVLVAIDTSGLLVDAGFDDAGDRVQLWYYTANELISNSLAFNQRNGI